MSLSSSPGDPRTAVGALDVAALAAHAPRVMRRRVAPMSKVTSTAQLLALRLSDFWRALAGQNLAFWAMCLYLVVEYVRPQQVFSALNDVPVGQFTLAIALAAHVFSGKWFELRSPGTWLLLAFTAVIVASSLTAFDSRASFDEFWEVWITWVVIYLLIVSVVNSEERMFIFITLWMAFHYYMSQGGVRQWAARGFQFASWGITGQPGWFANSGEFAIAMCMFVAVSWHFYLAARPYLTKWRKVVVLGMPATAMLGILGSSSRGAVLGLAGFGLWTLMRTKRRVRTLSVLAVLAAGVWVLLPPEQKARFTTVGEDDTSVSRLTYWKAGMDMARNSPVFGIGYGNWMTVYSRFYSQNSGGRSQVSHNIFVECVAELGWTGLLVFIALIIWTLRINWQTRLIARSGRAPPNVFQIELAHGLDAAMFSYLVAGFFVTVLYYPFFWINLALTVALNAIARRRVAGQDFQGHVSGPMPRGMPTRRGGMPAGRVRSGRAGPPLAPGSIPS